MSRSSLSRFPSWTLHFALVGGLGLGACQSSQGASRELGEGVEAPSLCPSCEPQAGGETGDFSGTPTPCTGVSSAVEVDAASAVALGFDVAELERRALRPIELPLQWRPLSFLLSTKAGDPPTGYEEYTQISAQLSSSGVFHHLRPDPALCDGTTCRRSGGVEVEQATCPDYLQLDVTAELHTHDGALRATTEGVASQMRPAPDDPLFNPILAFGFFTRADLRDVTGDLVLKPRPGGIRYHGTLHFSCRLSDDSCKGELAPSVMIYDSESTGIQYVPLYGHFPPGDAPTPGAGQAGTSR